MVVASRVFGPMLNLCWRQFLFTRWLYLGSRRVFWRKPDEFALRFCGVVSRKRGLCHGCGGSGFLCPSLLGDGH